MPAGLNGVGVRDQVLGNITPVVQEDPILHVTTGNNVFFRESFHQLGIAKLNGGDVVRTQSIVVGVPGGMVIHDGGVHAFLLTQTILRGHRKAIVQVHQVFGVVSIHFGQAQLQLLFVRG